MVNGHGCCHGGFVATLADSAFAFACNTYARSSSLPVSTSLSWRRPGSVTNWSPTRWNAPGSAAAACSTSP
jgi:acyl-coenzyme A thioesterase PaaI-like protein